MASRLLQRRRAPGFIHLPPPPAGAGAGAAGAAQASSQATIITPGHSASPAACSSATSSPSSSPLHFARFAAPAAAGGVAAPGGHADIIHPNNSTTTSTTTSSHHPPPHRHRRSDTELLSQTLAPSADYNNAYNNNTTTTTTNPIAIPPLPQVSSPYYSPSQIFPSSSVNKSYFPAFISQQPPSTLNANISSSAPATNLTHTTATVTPPLPKTPRSPSFFPVGASGIATNTTTPSPRSPLFFSVEPAASPLLNPSMTSHPTASSPLSGKPRSAATATSTAPTSARSYHVHLAQQQLAFQMQQRELIYQATRAANTMGGPISPRLLPLGSPGPVTPLTLEDNPAGYLVMPNAGLLSPSKVLQLQQSHIEKLAAAAERSAAAEEEEKKKAKSS
ncbi:hypothetical protein AA313_de0207344 [Arthrobotrys entomopaga]|nr:hypothetical protein AA313_de0207344 [Arthrobotrys entomopaga]